jgi:hypothetical protein
MPRSLCKGEVVICVVVGSRKRVRRVLTRYRHGGASQQLLARVSERERGVRYGLFRGVNRSKASFKGLRGCIHLAAITRRDDLRPPYALQGIDQGTAGVRPAAS